MRFSLSSILPFSLVACGSGGDPTGSGGGPSGSTAADRFEPPPLAEGFTRLSAATIPDIEPGMDGTWCQYVMAPVDRDMDVLDVTGSQSKYGHHVVAFSYAPAEGDVVGQDLPCAMGSSEFTNVGADASTNLSQGTFLGAASPAGGRVAALPEGVAFRLKKGSGIMLNLHYINAGDAPANGDAYIDLKLVDVDPNRLIGALFINFNSNFSVPPSAEVESTQDCVVESDVSVVGMSNHMHEWGARASTSVVRKDTEKVEVLREDTTWTAEMANNPTFANWTAEEPFVLHAGDTLRTSCTWNNDTTDALEFPREMCVSAGFALASGDTPKAPACFNGVWSAQGL